MQDLPKSNRPRLMDVRDDCLAVRILNMKGVETAAAVARRLRENGLHVGEMAGAYYPSEMQETLVDETASCEEAFSMTRTQSTPVTCCKIDFQNKHLN
jgi:hypothetical protein